MLLQYALQEVLFSQFIDDINTKFINMTHWYHINTDSIKNTLLRGWSGSIFVQEVSLKIPLENLKQMRV